MIGPLYEWSLAGLEQVEIEHADGRRRRLAVDEWTRPRPGDESLLRRCAGPTLDVGSGPGRLTVELAARAVPALGVDITPYAVEMTRAAGGLALVRDVFRRIPGTGRWATVLLADGNIGIGGEPAVLLRRVAELLAPGGQALVEVEAPGRPSRVERVRLRAATAAGTAGGTRPPGGLGSMPGGETEAVRSAGPDTGSAGSWFAWATVSVDDVAGCAGDAGLRLDETWTAARRWFAVLRRDR